MKHSITTSILLTLLAADSALQGQTVRLPIRPLTPVSKMSFNGADLYTLDAASGTLEKNNLAGPTPELNLFPGATRFAADGDYVWIGFHDGRIQKIHWATRAVAIVLSPTDSTGHLQDLIQFGDYVIRLTVIPDGLTRSDNTTACPAGMGACIVKTVRGGWVDVFVKSSGAIWNSYELYKSIQIVPDCLGCPTKDETHDFGLPDSVRVLNLSLEVLYRSDSGATVVPLQLFAPRDSRQGLDSHLNQSISVVTAPSTGGQSTASQLNGQLYYLNASGAPESIKQPEPGMAGSAPGKTIYQPVVDAQGLISNGVNMYVQTTKQLVPVTAIGARIGKTIPIAHAPAMIFDGKYTWVYNPATLQIEPY